MNWEPTSDYDNIETGLKERGFVGMNEMDSMGCCHKNEKHYVLRTDGLIIYSNIPFHTDAKYHKDPVVQYWGGEVFSFEQLDEIIKKTT